MERSPLTLAIALALLSACGGKPADNGANPDMQLLGDTKPAPVAGKSSPEVDAGKKLLQEKRYEDARATFASAVEKYPADPEAAYYLAETYAQLGDNKSAETYFKKTLELVPGHADATSNLSAIYLDEGRTDEAIAILQTALKSHPDVDLLHLNLARGLGQSKDKSGPPRDADGATREFQAAIKLSPSNADFHVAYGSFLGAVQGKTDAAMAELSTAQTLAKDDPDILAEIGATYRLIKDFKDCTDMYGKAIAVADTAANRTGRALCEYAAKNGADAETDLRAAINTDANNAVAYYWLGNVLAAKGDLKGALKAFQDCQRVDPNGRYAKPAGDKAQAVQSKIH
jgi:tetratricopeptide (TPR) repeat protein